MDLSRRLDMSYYKTIAVINEEHHVYLVQHLESGKFYVKKVLDVYSLDVYENLKEHPVQGVPRIIDFWEEDSQLTLIEEFVSGRTLDEIISSGTLTAQQLGKYMINLCNIMEEMHSHTPPMIHRDIKPSNIIISSYDNVILLDFNAARYYSNESDRDSDTRLLGTMGYAAPEQFGFGESTPRTDIYSAGMTLKNAAAGLADNSDIFDAVIAKCTQLDPKKRYKSARALKTAIQECLGINTRPDIKGPIIHPCFPPGFRTMNPWRMILATVTYGFTFALLITLEIDGVQQPELWFIRIMLIIIFLLNVAIGCDYLGIRKVLPFCQSKNKYLRLLGTLVTMAAVTFVLFMLTVYIGEIFLKK